MKVKLDALRRLLIQVLSSKYYSVDQAEQIAEVLMFAELTGKDTQGAIKLLGTEPMQNVKPDKEMEVIKETKTSCLIDGGRNTAILGCRLANQLAIKKAKENGIGLAGVFNVFSSSGTIGYYAYEAAKEGLISIIFAGSPGGVVPHGSLDPLFGTNPIAFGFPTVHDPLIFDMATSAITWYGLVRAKTLREDLPEGVAVDSEGNLTTNPDEAMKGGILPFDKSYKGSGLSMMVEVLTGPLTGGTFGTPNGDGDWSNLFIVIDPEILVGREQFKQRCSELIKKVKSSRRAKGIKKILVPGERGLKMKKKLEMAGELELDDRIYSELVSLI